MTITKDEFMRYEQLRKSGITNMFDLEVVMSITWLSKEKVLFIMKNYEKLYEKLIAESGKEYRRSRYALN